MADIAGFATGGATLLIVEEDTEPAAGTGWTQHGARASWGSAPTWNAPIYRGPLGAARRARTTFSITQRDAVGRCNLAADTEGRVGAARADRPVDRPKLRRRVGCKWPVTCEDFVDSAKQRSQKDPEQGRP